MKRVFGSIALCSLATILWTGCSSFRHRGPTATQENFGVSMARMNLWREAMFRFQRTIAANPGDAMAHNNLAVAYEANGDFDAAGKEYREAMRLDKTNQYIQKNYSRYVEFTSRNKKRQQRRETPAAPAVAAPAATGLAEVPPAAVTPPAPAPNAPPSETAPSPAVPAQNPPTQNPPTQNPPPPSPPSPPGGHS